MKRAYVILGICFVAGCGEFGGGAVVVPDVVVRPANFGQQADEGSATVATPTDGTSGTGEVETGGIGTLKGKVVLTGAVPSLPLPVLYAKGDTSAKDAATCTRQDVPDESLIVGEGNGVQNVFVYLQRAPKGVKIAPAPAAEVIYDQVSCRFDPHCIVVQTGTPVSVVNADDVPHNAHSYPSQQDGVNSVVSANDRTGVKITYQRAEKLPLKVGCDFHTWMIGWHLPLDHPFAAVTNENGEFEIPNLPAGKYEFVVWHENAGYVNRKESIVVKSGDPKLQTIEFPASKLSLN